MQWLQQLALLKTNLLALGTRRLIALGVAAVTIIGLVTVVGYYSSRPETEPLYVGLGQADVSRIGSTLHEAGIPYDISMDGTKVLVRRAQAPRARMLLAERGLPAGSTAGYELFDKLGPLGLTSFMQDVTRTRALEGELARTIQAMKGVTSARVHLVVPSSAVIRRNQQPTSASVVVRIEGPRPQSMAQVIRHIVSAAVPGLAPDSVSVMSTDGTMLLASGDGGMLGSEKMIELERAVSQEAQENIRRTLAPFMGIENFEVSVSARINLDKHNVSEQVWDPDSKSERSTRVIKELGSSQNAGARQAVTVEQNVPTEQGAGAAGEQSRKNSERRETVSNFEISSKTKTTVSEGYRIEQLQVSLVVNRKKFPTGAGGPSVEARLKEIEAIAAAAAGLDTKRGDKINLVAQDFQELPPEPSGKAGIIERLALSLDTVIISVTAIAALLILVWLGLLPSIRTIIASRSEQAQGGALEAGGVPMLEGQRGAAGVAGVTRQGEEDGQAALAAPRQNPTQNKLNELIERDEKIVAEILRQWIRA